MTSGFGIWRSVSEDLWSVVSENSGVSLQDTTKKIQRSGPFSPSVGLKLGWSTAGWRQGPLHTEKWTSLGIFWDVPKAHQHHFRQFLMRFLRWPRSLSCNWWTSLPVAAEVTAERTSWWWNVDSTGIRAGSTAKIQQDIGRFWISKPSAIFGTRSFRWFLVKSSIHLGLSPMRSPYWDPGALSTLASFTKKPRSMRRNRTVVQLLPYLETSIKASCHSWPLPHALMVAL